MNDTTNKVPRFLCARCGGDRLVQDASIELNTGEWSWLDSVWCRDCEDEVEVTEQASTSVVATIEI